jgi:tetratricopeptide (TPR) repeat protein
MVLRYSFWAILLAASTMLTGCHSPPVAHAKTPPDVIPPLLPAQAIVDRPENTAAFAEAHAHYGAGIIHELNNEPELALQEYYEAALKDPANETLVLEVSGEFLRVKQPEKALEVLQRATAQPNASSAIFARLGFIYSRLGKSEDAIKASRTAIQKEPNSLAGYQNIYLNFLQNKQTPEALSLLDDAAKVPDANAEFLIGLSELYANIGLQAPAQKTNAFEKASMVLQRAEKLKITDPQLRLRLADSLNLVGKDDEAAKIYRALLKDSADAPLIRESVRAKLADIYLHGHDSKQATEQLEAIIRDNPTDAQAYYFLGSIAFDAKRYPQASDYFTKTLLLNPEFEPAYYDLASAQLGEEKISEALATLDKVRQKFSPTFVLEYLTAMAYSHQKNYTNAISHYTAAEVIASANEPKHLTAVFYFEVAATYERQGDFAQAEKYFEKCLALSPNFAEAQNYLGYMWVDRGEKLEQARALIEKAVAAEPTNAAFLDSMAWALFKLKQPKPALDYILRAVKFSEGEDATLYDHLGDIYSALGQKDKAMEAWRKSLKLEKNETVQKKLGTPAGDNNGSR